MKAEDKIIRYELRNGRVHEKGKVKQAIEDAQKIATWTYSGKYVMQSNFTRYDSLSITSKNKHHQMFSVFSDQLLSRTNYLKEFLLKRK